MDGHSTATRRTFLAALIGLALFVPGTGYAPPQRLTALAPFEIWADGFRDARGVAVDEHGTVFVTDAEADTVTRISTDGHRRVIARGLDRPTGLVVDHDGDVVVVETGGGRVTRLASTGTRAVLARGLRRPQGIALDTGGTLYVTARGVTRRAELEHDDDDDDAAEPEVILAIQGGRTAMFLDGVRRARGIAVGDGTVYVASRGLRHDPPIGGAILAVPVRSDGSAGTPVLLEPTGVMRAPGGVARDRLGAIFTTALRLDRGREHLRSVIAKLSGDDRAAPFAVGLDDPQGVAFDADGNLIVADGRSGRIVRFRAPAPPALVPLPAFTRVSSIVVSGTAPPGARVDLFAPEPPRHAVALADAAGAFAGAVDVVANARNEFQVVATGHGGDGLSSQPSAAGITHDGIAPALTLVTPAPGAHVRQQLTVQGRADDAGSGIASLGFAVDGRALATATTPVPSSGVTGTVRWDTTAVADGVHTVMLVASDIAGNTLATTRTVIVDNTAPDTVITAGPEGAISDTTAVFTFAGVDAVTPASALRFSWRLNGSAWSAFTTETTATFAGLSGGAHVFEVKAQDLSGNEDTTPAERRFSVSAVSVTITAPAAGAVVGAGVAIVRGTVSAGGADVGVTVNGIPAAVEATTFVALVPVSPETSSFTAIATIAGGTTVSDVVGVTVVPAPSGGPVLIATPASGPAPLAVAFSMVSTPATPVALDADGDGRSDVTGTSADTLAFTYSRPGIYVATAMVSGPSGTLTTSTVVHVVDRASFDATLRGKWAAMKSTLRVGDLPAALDHIALGARDDYRVMLSALAPRFPQIDQILTDIFLVSLDDGRAEYQMIRMEGGIRLSHFIVFVRDADGIWRLKFF